MPAPTLHVSNHPAVLHKLAILRDEDTEPKKFREVVRELSWLVGYEALADVRVRPLEIRTPNEPMTAAELDERIGFVPILRAGLGMVDAMLELMPTAQVWHLGLFRDERTLMPVEYYNKLPDSASVDLCLILDPMLATGGSATAAIEVLKKWGAVADQARQPDRGARGRGGGRGGASGRRRSTARRSTARSTTVATSSPAWATPATASSGPATRTDRPSDRVLGAWASGGARPVPARYDPGSYSAKSGPSSSSPTRSLSVDPSPRVAPRPSSGRVLRIPRMRTVSGRNVIARRGEDVVGRQA